jgi:uncharacterized protein CbrC (UPF0167 family)
MSNDQPYFRFNPGAYEEGRSFERSSDTCDVCLRPSVWKYTGGVYATEDPVVCARCIANGELGRFLGGKHFSLHDIEMNGAEPSLAKEILQRTPGSRAPTSYALVFKEIDGERYRAVVDFD